MSFSFSWCSTGGPGAQLCAECWLSLPYLVTNGSPKLLGGSFPYHISSLTHLISNSFDLQFALGPRGPPSPDGGFVYHILLRLSLLQLADFLSTPSYILFQSPTQSPTQSLEWHVWSSSSGNNCHAVQRSLSSGTSVYECIMGFYLIPFRQPIPPTRFLSITGHWNVLLPSAAPVWNGMFDRAEGQYITLVMKSGKRYLTEWNYQLKIRLEGSKKRKCTDTWASWRLTPSNEWRCKKNSERISQENVVYWLSSYELDTTIRVQILDETDCISHSINTLGKGMNPVILPPAMGK